MEKLAIVTEKNEGTLKALVEQPGYYGFLSNDQQKALDDLKHELKETFKDENIAKRYDDVRLVRFLRARKFDLPNALKMVKDDIEWRKEERVDTILSTFKKEMKNGQAMQDNWPHEWHKVDKKGVPVYFERIGLADPKSWCNVNTLEDSVRFHIYLMELGDQGFIDAVQKIERAPDGGILIVEDLTGLAWKHFYSPAVNAVKECLLIDQDHYPEALRKLYIINAPKIFTIFWKFFKPFMDPRTLEKTEVLGSDFMSQLENEIDKEHIPKYLGGLCSCPNGCVREGGKFLNSQEAAEAAPIEVVVEASKKYEQHIIVEKEGTALGWEFTTKDYNIGFSVYHEEDGEVHPYFKCDSHLSPEQNRIVATKTGKYTFCWDNSFSKFRKKHLIYQVFVEPPSKKKRNKKKKKKNQKKEELNS